MCIFACDIRIFRVTYLIEGAPPRTPNTREYIRLSHEMKLLPQVSFAGEIKSVSDGVGLALLRLEAIEKAMAAGQPMTAGGVAVQVAAPAWLDLTRNASRS